MLTTLFGTAQLRLQEAFGANLDTSGPNPRVPNFVVVSIRRDSFVAEHQGKIEEERDRFRHDLEEAARAFLASHGWQPGGTGALVVNVLLRAISEECTVQLRTVLDLYELKIRDDGGERVVPVRFNPATIGREHGAHPRGFIPVKDGSRTLSREHLLLRYADLALTVRCLGQNQTTLNGALLGADDVPMHEGDVIECGRCRITLSRL